MHIISVAKALKNVSHIRGTQRMISVKYLFGCKVRQGWIQSSSSDLLKSLKFLPNLISQLFIAVNEINYPPCFIGYYEINKTTERLFHRSHSKPSPSQAKWTSHRSRVAWGAFKRQENGSLRALNFKFSWGSMPPNPPSLVGANHSCKILDPPLGRLNFSENFSFGCKVA